MWDEIIEKGDNMHFQVGDRVRKKDGTTFMNGEHVVTIDHFSDSRNRAWFKETGTNLLIDGLEKVEEGDDMPTFKKPSRKNSDNDQTWLPEHFMFAGQRVMINPENDRYQGYLNAFGTDSGYVIDHKASKGDLLQILTKGKLHMPSWSVAVRMDNGQEYNLKVRDLLQIDAPFKSVEKIHIQDRGRMYLVDGEENPKIDKYIIQDRKPVVAREFWDEAFKNEMIAQAYEKLSNQ